MKSNWKISTWIRIGILCVTLITTPMMAQEFFTRSLEILGDASLIIKGLKAGNEDYDVVLERYYNPQDSQGVYWRYKEIDLTYTSKTVHVITDRVYLDEAPLNRHQLDIYYTDAPENHRVVIFIPGGAWQSGDKEMYSELGYTLAGYYSFTVVIVNYRLSNEEDGQAVHPDHINDVAAAFAWVKSNISEYGDANNLFLFGQSAGGHLASLLATDPKYLAGVGCSPSDIRAVISMSGAYDLPDLVKFPDNPLGLSADETLMFKKIMDNAFGGWSDDILSDPSPDRHIHSEQMPFLVIYSADDLAGFEQEAMNFSLMVKQLDPPPEIMLRKIERTDYTDRVWERAAEMAQTRPGMEDYIGHFAEVVAINMNEPGNYVSRMIANFILSH